VIDRGYQLHHHSEKICKYTSITTIISKTMTRPVGITGSLIATEQSGLEANSHLDPSTIEWVNDRWCGGAFS
jgi:hypothetical protein